MRAAALAGLLLLAPAAGCGWSRGLTLPEGVHTVGVEVFRTQREIYERGLEAALHRALSRAVSDLVQAPLVAPEDADLVVRGAIEGYRRRSGIRNQDNQLIETAVEVRIRAELHRRQPGGSPEEASLRSYTARVWSGYGLDESGNELLARERALRYLAETIVLELFADLPGDPL